FQNQQTPLPERRLTIVLEECATRVNSIVEERLALNISDIERHARPFFAAKRAVGKDPIAQPIENSLLRVHPLMAEIQAYRITSPVPLPHLGAEPIGLDCRLRHQFEQTDARRVDRESLIFRGDNVSGESRRGPAVPCPRSRSADQGPSLTRLQFRLCPAQRLIGIGWPHGDGSRSYQTDEQYSQRC